MFRHNKYQERINLQLLKNSCLRRHRNPRCENVFEDPVMINDKLRVTEDVNIGKSLTVHNGVHVSGPAIFNNCSHVKGKLKVCDKLSVNGDTCIKQDLHVNGDITTQNTLSLGLDENGKFIKQEGTFYKKIDDVYIQFVNDIYLSTSLQPSAANNLVMSYGSLPNGKNGLLLFKQLGSDIYTYNSETEIYEVVVLVAEAKSYELLFSIVS